MGIVVDSCKSTIKCCDSDDETGYKQRNYSRYIPSDSEEENSKDDIHFQIKNSLSIIFFQNKTNNLLNKINS